MDSLPSELLLKIFSYLTFTEKLNCASTHKAWKSLILRDCLYEDFKIDGRLERLNNHFKVYETQQRQVRRLKSTSIEAIDVLAIPAQFPNLAEFSWGMAESYNEAYDDEADDGEADKYEGVVNEQNAQHWRNITRFQEHDHCPLSAALLKNGGLCNLIELDITFLRSREQQIMDLNLCKPIIQQLSKAPNLKILKFKNSPMTLIDLNQLHLNAQQLEILCLNNISFCTNEHVATTKTDGLTELHISNYIRNDKFLAHVAGKYPDLKTLKIHGKKNDDEIYDEQNGEDSLVKFAYSPHLETYDVDIHPITPKIMRALDANGTKLKTIRIKMPFENPQAHMKDLFSSNQKDSVETLKIDFTCGPDVKEINVVEFLKYLEDFSRLKALEMDGVHDVNQPNLSFPFYKCLKKLPHLETIKLQFLTIEHEPSVSLMKFVAGQKVKSKLKKLILNDCGYKSKEKLLSFLSETCPKLFMQNIIINRYGGIWLD